MVFRCQFNSIRIPCFLVKVLHGFGGKQSQAVTHPFGPTQSFFTHPAHDLCNKVFCIIYSFMYKYVSFSIET